MKKSPSYQSNKMSTLHPTNQTRLNKTLQWEPTKSKNSLSKTLETKKNNIYEHLVNIKKSLLENPKLGK